MSVKFQFMLAIMIAGLVALGSLGSVAAQSDEDDDYCPSCRTNNFYYVLVAAIIIFAIFFYWTNRNKVPKPPVEPDEKPKN
jgi:hypothetical protein